MKYYDQKTIEKGRRNIKIIFILFSIIYGIFLVDQLFMLKESSLLENIKMGIPIFMLYLFYRGNNKVYFYVQMQIFTILAVITGTLLLLLYDISPLIQGWKDSTLVILGFLICLAIPIIFVMKSKFIGDLEVYMEYRRR